MSSRPRTGINRASGSTHRWRNVGAQTTFYAEYARGFLIPSLASLYVANPAYSNIEPERSTNWQAGLVYHGDRLSVDFDGYYIDFTNKFVSSTSPIPGVGTVWTNIGGAVYKGIEGQISYAITPNIAVFANGSINSAKANDTGLQIAYAPKGTAAGGVIVKQGPFRFSVIDKYTGAQSSTGNGIFDIPGYNTAIVAASYEVGAFRLGVEVTNLFNSQEINQINGSQYYYQAPRAVTGDITFRF